MNSTRWCYTLNNYSDYELANIDQIDCKYMIYGKEVGANGTPHLQGYVIFNTMKRLTGVRKLIDRAHWEVAKGDTASNIVYCSKEGLTQEVGTRPLSKKEIGDAEKQRWKEVVRHAEEGTIRAYDSKIYFKNLHTCLKLRAMHEEPIAMTRTAKVFWGPTGTGKTRQAWLEAGQSAYIKGPRTKWWDGYQNQENVIIDEFRGKIAIEYLLTWLDDYPVRLEVKGTTVCSHIKRIWITSNLYPDKWFPEEDPESVKALLRRLQVVHWLGTIATREEQL